ncbi:MAG: aminotransferase class V-fold PLP-dependent enzyme [Oscillospiraceae bacterium]|nr:aminotransferase class V-fold PLP-dependent enzyme [Oscillospiraceae bacterium]
METMIKYSFKNDYSEFAHPRIMEAILAQGTRQFEGYGLDEYCLKAADLIKAKINEPTADVHFIAGGTHANLVVISAALRPHEAVIAVETGHIFVHETGAIEATGHKIITVKGENGKISVSDIEDIVAAHDDEHMVNPRLVYISHTTECGTIYSKAELTEISNYCKENKLYLFLDGARLGAALNSPYNDLTYTDIPKLADVFYIGGTKNGALFGEAVVIVNENLKVEFRSYMKQRGALLAKGAALGIQFSSLFENGLYDELAQKSNNMALKMAEGIIKCGYNFLYPPQTNLIIPIFPKYIAEKLQQLYGFYDWESFGETTAVRIVTSWATPESIVDEFLADLVSMSQ